MSISEAEAREADSWGQLPYPAERQHAMGPGRWKAPCWFFRTPRQHRRMHDGATLYDPETGAQGQQVKPGCQIGAKCTGANS